jgi:hypothetical protein
VAHICNPSYSGGRDQEDKIQRQPQANSLEDPISKIPITKRAGRVGQGEGPEFKPQYCKNKTKQTNKQTLSVFHYSSGLLPMKKYICPLSTNTGCIVV